MRQGITFFQERDESDVCLLSIFEVFRHNKDLLCFVGRFESKFRNGVLHNGIDLAATVLHLRKPEDICYVRIKGKCDITVDEINHVHDLQQQIAWGEGG